MTLADIPISLSPVGLSNRPVGTAGRPGEAPAAVRAWRWEEVQKAGVADGWVFVNDKPFCPDTGHLSAREILALARMVPAAREARIRAHLERWFRPAQLRRRVRVLIGRTRLPAIFNGVTFFGMAAMTAYLAGDLASWLPVFWSERLASALPWLLLGFFALHVAAVVMAWRGMRRLKALRPEKRGANLFGALLLPPQALRLRALVGEGFFPAQHPLAAVVAWESQEAGVQWSFNVVADLRWPVGDVDDLPLGREVATWFRVALEAKVRSLLARSGVTPEDLLAAPRPDSPESCRYCPRCRDQFVAGREVCPHGVVLEALPPMKK